MGASRPFVCQQPHDGYKRADDRALVLAVQGGDVAAYAELFRRHHRSVKRVCARRLGELEADEVAQATFVRAFERIRQCEGDRRFGAWVHVIAQRLCLDLMRARTRTVPDDDPLRGDRPALNVVIDLDAGTVTEEALVRRERTERVQEALALLPDRQRAVVVARHFEDRRPSEIAASLGLSVGAVDSLLLRGRRRLALNYEHALADSSVAAVPSVTSTGAGMASGALPIHLPALPDALVNVAHTAVAALPAAHGDAHAPLRRLAGIMAAAAAPILVAAPPQPALTSRPAPALSAAVPPPVAAAGAPAALVAHVAPVGGAGGSALVTAAGASAGAAGRPGVALVPGAGLATVDRSTSGGLALPAPAATAAVQHHEPAGAAVAPGRSSAAHPPPNRPTASHVPVLPPVPAAAAVPGVWAPAGPPGDHPAGPPAPADPSAETRWVRPAVATAAAHIAPPSMG